MNSVTMFLLSLLYGFSKIEPKIGAKIAKVLLFCGLLLALSGLFMAASDFEEQPLNSVLINGAVGLALFLCGVWMVKSFNQCQKWYQNKMLVNIK